MSDENAVTPQAFASQMQQLGYGLEAQGADVDAEKEKMSLVDYKMVSFSLAEKDYAIDIMKVKEIVKDGRFTYVPNALPFVLGVYNLRGDIIPIVDLRLFFNIDIPEREPGQLENMLIVSVNDLTFGIVVDVIDKVVGVQKSTIQPPHPLFGDISVKYIQGVVESAGRLYILLDIDRIFGNRGNEDENEDEVTVQQMIAQQAKVRKEMKQTVNNSAKSVPAKETKASAKEVDLSFVVSGLSEMRKFTVAPINEAWVKERYAEWEKERGKGKTQLQDITDCDKFLAPFYSACTGDWWTKEYAEAIGKALPDNAAKQIVVWNPGCGKGQETYSLACVLKKRYPDAKIRIYAHEVDLLNISNAPLLQVPQKIANDWFAPYITKKASGEYVFTQEIRDSIMFEYHDCQNTNALPAVDIVFARDVMSFLSQKAQEGIIEDFKEKVKGNGIVMLGEHETLEGRAGWNSHRAGNIKFFSK